MKQIGTVIRTEQGDAWVSVRRMSACDGCHKHAEGCTVCSLMGGEKKATVRLKNTVQAQVGDRVELEAESRKVLFYAFLIFLLPLMVGAVAAMVGTWLFSPNTAWLWGLGGVVSVYPCLLLSEKLGFLRSEVRLLRVIHNKEMSDDHV